MSRVVHRVGCIRAQPQASRPRHRPAVRPARARWLDPAHRAVAPPPICALPPSTFLGGQKREIHRAIHTAMAMDDRCSRIVLCAWRLHETNERRRWTIQVKKALSFFVFAFAKL
jgi:hypothetical protein